MSSKVELVPTESVKKHAATIHTSGNLPALPRKLFNVLLYQAYDELLTKRTHTIPVKLLSPILGFDSKDVQCLRDALEKLSSTNVQFNLMEDGKESWSTMSLLSYGNIKDGICTFRYDEYLAERLFEPEIYAAINIGVQRKIKGSYALNLYENCVRYKDVGSTGWIDLARFRDLMGAESQSYDEFKVLKRTVIDQAMREVNKSTDIFLTLAEPKKDGRKIIAIKFLIKENPQYSLLRKEDLDEYSETRKTEVYKRLRVHGLSDKLACSMVEQDRENTEKVVAYVEGQAEKRKIKGSTGGYIRSLIESGAEVGPSKFAQEQTEKKKAVGAIQKTITKKDEDESAKRVSEHKKAAAWFAGLDEATQSDMRVEFEKENRSNPMFAMEKGRSALFAGYLARIMKESKGS